MSKKITAIFNYSIFSILSCHGLDLWAFLGVEIIPNEWNFRISLGLSGRKRIHCNMAIYTEQHDTENHRHDDRFINWAKMESAALFKENSNTV
jgi:hypothetical protein